MALDDTDDVGFQAVERKVEPAVIRGREREGKFALADRQRRGTVAIFQADLLLGPLPPPERDKPLPGTVVALLAEVGAKLEKGAPILTLEVMKMEQTLRAPFAGVLKRIRCKVGDIVGEGVELAVVEPAAA